MGLSQIGHVQLEPDVAGLEPGGGRIQHGGALIGMGLHELPQRVAVQRRNGGVQGLNEIVAHVGNDAAIAEVTPG